ncbi:MAG: prolyl oligopeptidase family serine peptidase [Acidimicrobiales bacterium]
MVGADGRVGMLPDDVGGLRHAEDPRVSPDGTRVAFTVVDVDLEANRYRQRVWVGSTDGQVPAQPFSAGPDDHLARWSPDGRRLALCSSPHDGPSQICVIPVASGGERVVLASWPEPPTELAWSPDGAQLAFVARVPDPERYGKPGDAKPGEGPKAADMPPRRITRLFSRLDNQGWVVDRPNQVMVVPVDGSATPHVLTGGPFEAEHPAWSPDGARLAFSSARHETWDLDGAVDLWTVAADGSGQPEKLTGTDAAYSSPSWSPDGTRLAYLYYPSPRDEPRHSRVGVLDLENRATHELTAGLDRNCGPYGAGRAPVWWAESLLFSVEDAGNVHVYQVPSSGDGKVEPVAEGQRWVGSWDWAGGALAMAVTTPTSFAELVAIALPAPGGASTATASTGTASTGTVTGAAAGAERRLTNLTGRFAARRALGQPVAFTTRSADGTEVPCWAIPPVGASPGRRYPTLLNVHGGPFTSYGNKFFDEFQFQAGSGFGVLYCNPRGSSGYEEAWGRAVRWPECETDPGSGWGGVDFDDVMACVEEGCRRFDWVDTGRLGILGGSYGGYMTSWAIGHTKRFKAACSERACNNLLTLENNSDIAGMFRGYVGRTHVEDPDAYRRQSPSTYVAEMTTPVLILHSEDDLRCPISQAEELFVALRLLGRGPVMVRFPGESHELSRSGSPRHRVERAKVILEWFHDKLGT